MIIKTHKELADHIAGKRILHLNSLGKDSVVALEWLASYAKPAKVVSVFFEFLARHPADDTYLDYLKKRYPQVSFIKEPNGHELTKIICGAYQSPFDIMNEFNKYDYEKFFFEKHANNLLTDFDMDLICIGFSAYESVSRAMLFHKKGLVIGKKIYPIGLMRKKQIFDIIKSSNLKLHPCYKVSRSTFDHPSYYKMRAAFIANPEYKKHMLQTFPLLTLDEYRYEKLFEK